MSADTDTDRTVHGPDEPLTIGEMSRRTGVAPSALHFYESCLLYTSDAADE